jgi:hypothetical protein
MNGHPGYGVASYYVGELRERRKKTAFVRRRCSRKPIQGSFPFGSLRWVRMTTEADSSPSTRSARSGCGMTSECKCGRPSTAARTAPPLGMTAKDEYRDSDPRGGVRMTSGKVYGSLAASAMGSQWSGPLGPARKFCGRYCFASAAVSWCDQAARVEGDAPGPVSFDSA